MSAPQDKNKLINFWTARIQELLQMRSNLQQEDLEYVVEKVAALRDERLKQCITTLIGWGDDERAELETFCAISLELMKDASPSRVREAARRVEIRYYVSKDHDASGA